MHASIPNDPSALQHPLPSMAEVWDSVPVAADVRLVAPEAASVQRLPGMGPYRESPAWSAMKSAVQLALVLSVVGFVVEGGRAPVATLTFGAACLLLMLGLAIADRERFIDHAPSIELVDVVDARSAAPPVGAGLQVDAPLVPLVHQMQVAMPEGVSVT